MAEYNLSRGTTTDFTNQVEDFIVDAKALDVANPNQEEFYWFFSEATTNFGYYFSIPEIYSAANALATWAFGKGWETKDETVDFPLKEITPTKVVFEGITFEKVGDNQLNIFVDIEENGKIETVKFNYTKQ